MKACVKQWLGEQMPGVDEALLASIYGEYAETAKRLRCRDVPVIARIQDDRVVLDVRTLLPGEEAIVAEAAKEIPNG